MAREHIKTTSTVMGDRKVVEGEAQSPVSMEDGGKDKVQGKGTCLEERREVMGRTRVGSSIPPSSRLERKTYSILAKTTEI